jgi:hypothetical protein
MRETSSNRRPAFHQRRLLANDFVIRQRLLRPVRELVASPALVIAARVSQPVPEHRQELICAARRRECLKELGIVECRGRGRPGFRWLPDRRLELPPSRTTIAERRIAGNERHDDRSPLPWDQDRERFERPGIDRLGVTTRPHPTAWPIAGDLLDAECELETLPFASTRPTTRANQMSRLHRRARVDIRRPPWNHRAVQTRERVVGSGNRR